MSPDIDTNLDTDMGDGYYRVDIVLDGALYKMIRNIIGGCVEVGYGTMTLETLKHLLDEVPFRALNPIVVYIITIIILMVTIIIIMFIIIIITIFIVMVIFIIIIVITSITIIITINRYHPGLSTK
jgi:hypothetical protein